jgi:hypothetical protein
MMHCWALIFFAANWDFVAFACALCGGIAGSIVGWLVRGRHEDAENARALSGIQADQTTIYGGGVVNIPPVLRADTPGRHEIEKAPVFHTQSGTVIESPRIWDKRIAESTHGAKTTVPYEELEGMFLDQFLIRFFHSLMPQKGELWGWTPTVGFIGPPWETFVRREAWAKEMPLLFEQLTGYALNEIQLNNAIAEYARRLQKTPRCAFCNDGPIMPKCPVCGRGNDPNPPRADTPGPHETARSSQQA